MLAHHAHTKQIDLFSEAGGFAEASSYHNMESSGFFAHLVKMNKDGKRRMIQRSHRISSLAYVIDLADARLDNYISQAEFLKPNRRVVNLARLNLNFVDLDIYHIDPSGQRFTNSAQMSGAVRIFCDDENIPQPSLIAFSGRGLYLKWLYEKPIPRQAVPRWNALQRRLVALFSSFGADPAAKDASRVLRLMGTTNTKSGEIVRVLHVEEESGKPKLYGFDYLANEILSTERGVIERARAERRLKIVEGGKGQTGNTSGLRKLSPMRLNWDRLEDLRKLAEIRDWTKNGVPRGHREVYLFWSANFMLSSGATHPNQMFHEISALAKEVCPGSAMDAEVRRSLSTVYKKGLAHAAGQRVEFNGIKFSPLYTPRNQTLIDYLGITPEEEKQLGTIISEREAAERHRKRRIEGLRKSGAVDRASYLESAEMRRVEALLLRAKGMKQREIAKAMGVSVMAVNGYLKSKS